MITIQEWTNNKTILITGGAGFFGKVLTEKLLRCCKGVKRIYLIIRSKGGKNPQERWNEIAKDSLFEKLLAEEPDVMDRKVTVLDGDMSLIHLGLSQETIEELKNTVNIIFHSAATVRFNDPLQKAILANTRGTLEMCKLASETKNFEVFVHVSTAYCNHNLKANYYEEEIYEPCQDWRTIIKIIEEENPVVMNTLCYKIIEDHPNTYTFSKSLGEKIVEEYSSKFPTVIVRPTVVVGTVFEPIYGWTDNLNGLMGITTGVCKGVLRVIKGRGSCCLDYVSVDVAINGLIVSGWEKANSVNKELAVYNCAYADVVPISFEQILKDGVELNKTSVPLENDIWYPFLLFIVNDFFFHIVFYLIQVLPAAIIDLILYLLKKKPRLIKITMKIYQGIQALSSFTVEDIKFNNKKYHELWDILIGDEAKMFCLRPPSDFKWKEVMLRMHQGMKVYFLKETLEDAKYKKKLMRLYYIHLFVKGILICAAFMTSYKLINAMVYRYIL